MNSGILMMSGLFVCFICTAVLVLQFSSNPALAVSAIGSAVAAFSLDGFEASLPPGYAYLFGAAMLVVFSGLTFALWFFFEDDDDFPEVNS